MTLYQTLLAFALLGGIVLYAVLKKPASPKNKPGKAVTILIALDKIKFVVRSLEKKRKEAERAAQVAANLLAGFTQKDIGDDPSREAETLEYMTDLLAQKQESEKLEAAYQEAIALIKHEFGLNDDLSPISG